MGLMTQFGLFLGLRRQCKKCGAALKKTVEFCPGCGTEAPFKCLKCGAPAGKDTPYCSACGNEIVRPRTVPVCESCGADVAEQAKFCNACGARRDEVKADRKEDITLRSLRWEPELGQFAVRLDQLDLGTQIDSGIVVEPGVIGVLIRNGQPEAPLLPGRYRLPTLPTRKDGQMFEKADIGAMVLVCSGDQKLRFVFENLRIAEGVPVVGAMDVVIHVRDPLAFTANVLGGRAEFRVAEFLARYEGELRNAAAEAVAGYPWESLKSDQQTKAQITAAVGNHIKQMLDRDGMELVGLRAMEVVNRDLEKLDEQAYRRMIRRGVLNEDLKDFEVEFDEEVAKIYQDERRFELHKRRAELLHQMEQQLASDAKKKLTTEEDLSVFVHQIDKDRLLRDDDMARFKREIAEANQDHEMAREHLLARLRIERDFELRAFKLGQEQNLSRQAIDFQMAQERQRLDHELAIQKAKLDATIAARKVAQAAELEMENERHRQRLQQELEKEVNEAKRAELKLNIRKLEDEHDLAVLEKKRAIDMKDQRERQATALEAQRHQVEATLKLQEQQYAHEARMRGMDVEVEKTRIQSGAEMVEARIRGEEARKRAEEAARDLERERQRTERDLQEERLRSDQVMDRMERMANRVIDATGRLPQQAPAAPPASEALYKTAMENMSKVAASAAGRSDAGEGSQIKCAKCGQRQSEGNRFCEQCGEKMS